MLLELVILPSVLRMLADCFVGSGLFTELGFNGTLTSCQWSAAFVAASPFSCKAFPLGASGSSEDKLVKGRSLRSALEFVVQTETLVVVSKQLLFEPLLPS